MATVTEIRDLVSQYLHNSIDHKTFTGRFSRILYDIQNSQDAAVLELVSSIRPLVADAVVGLVDEPDFKFSLATSLIDIKVISQSVSKRETKTSLSPYYDLALV